MYVIRSTSWHRGAPEHQYWDGAGWNYDVAYARVFQRRRAAQAIAQDLRNPERDDAGLPVKRGRKKQDWTPRAAADVRTDVRAIEIV